MDKKESSGEREGGGDRWRMCSGDICGSLYLIPHLLSLSLSLSLSPLLLVSAPGPSELSAAGGEWMANSYLGRRTRKEREEERGRREGERARPAATFHRVIIVISLGGLDSVVPSRERERERKR